MYAGIRRSNEQDRLNLSDEDYMSWKWGNPELYRPGEPLSYQGILETTEKYNKKSAVGVLDSVQRYCQKADARGEVHDISMQNFISSAEAARRIIIQEKDIQAWDCLRSMIENSYFERSWIIQELVLGKKPII